MWPEAPSLFKWDGQQGHCGRPRGLHPPGAPGAVLNAPIHEAGRQLAKTSQPEGLDQGLGPGRLTPKARPCIHTNREIRLRSRRDCKAVQARETQASNVRF